MRFRSDRDLERHDGLQVDLPILGKPYGFAVDRLYVAGTHREKTREVIQAAAGTVVEVELPFDAPEIPRGAPVYCSSSQAVKQRYRFAKPKPGLWHGRMPLRIELTLKPDRLIASATSGATRVEKSLPGTFGIAQDAAGMEQAANACFGRLGQSRFVLDAFLWHNEEGRFAPVSQLNQLRRDLVDAMEIALNEHRETSLAAIIKQAVPSGGQNRNGNPASLSWSIKVDRTGFLADFNAEDFQNVDEIVIDIARDHPTILREQLARIADHVGRDRIRLALPALTRSWEDKAIRHKVDTLKAAGWRKWEAANLSAWQYLGVDPLQPDGVLDLSTDWSVYVMNRLAALQLFDMGVSRFTLSPEDGLDNARNLWSEFGSRAVLIVYQDTPQFLAESCAYANLIGGCPGKANCSFESMEMVSSHGERVTALDYHCRTIVLNQEPFCLSSRLSELKKAGVTSLRADFIYRAYPASIVRDRWRLLRQGKAIRGTQAAKFETGVL